MLTKQNHIYIEMALEKALTRRLKGRAIALE